MLIAFFKENAIIFLFRLAKIIMLLNKCIQHKMLQKFTLVGRAG